MSRSGQAVLHQHHREAQLPSSLFPWQCHGCGVALAGLAGGTALPWGISPTLPSLLAPGMGRALTGGQCHPCPALPAPDCPHLSPSPPQPGDSVMVVPTLPDEEAKQLFPKGVFTKELPSGKKYLRYTPQPE